MALSLADELIKKGVLKNPRLIEAFRAVDRKDFAPEELERFAYADEPLPIGEGQTISQPWTVAFMLELLDPQPGEHILEIGYGSGWQTALMAAIGANVYAIERIPRLCEFGKDNVERWRSKSSCSIAAGSVNFFCQDGIKGLPEMAKRISGFDKIIAAAALEGANTPLNNRTADSLPIAWKEQLKIGGRIVAPIGHSIFLFTKKTHNQFDEREYPGFAFVPLVEEN